MRNLNSWLKNGEYLPRFMRDFHDQKDLFKTIFDRVDMSDESWSNITCRQAHIFTIDCFLWFMAKRGYTLQKCRVKTEFRSIERDLIESADIRQKDFDNYIKSISGL